MVDRSKAPKIVNATDFKFVLPDIEHTVLNNGMPFYFYQGGAQEVAEISIVVPGGVWVEQASGVALAVAALLKNGTSNKSANEINEIIEFCGASIKIVVQNDNILIQLHCLSKHLKQLVPLLCEILTDAQFPEKELQLYQTNSLQRLKVHLLQCDFVANQKIDSMLFGEQHPYGRYSSQEAIEQLTREALLHYYTSFIKGGNYKIFVAGNYSNNQLQHVMHHFGDLELVQKDNTVINHTIQTASDRVLNYVNDPDGVQAAIRIARLFPNRQHPDFVPMILLNTLFGGYFGSRLMANIREEKGYTYGIYSGISANKQESALVIQSEVGRNVATPAIKEIYKEMTLLRDELVDEEELLLVKNYLLGNVLSDLDGPFQIMQRWRNIIVHGFTKENFYKNIDIYKTTTAEELQQLAKKYLNPEEFIQVTVV